MPVAQYAITLSLGGVTIQRNTTRTGDHPNTYEVQLPVGKAGSLTVRGGDGAGTITATAHGLLANDIVDVHWTLAGVHYARRNVTVDTVPDANSITFDDTPAAAGDVLPPQATAVVVTKQVTINTYIDGDAIQIIGILLESGTSGSTAYGELDLRDAGGASIETLEMKANETRVWDVYGGDTNVFSGNVITNARASNGSSTEVLTLKIISLEDATP